MARRYTLGEMLAVITSKNNFGERLWVETAIDLICSGEKISTEPGAALKLTASTRSSMSGFLLIIG